MAITYLPLAILIFSNYIVGGNKVLNLTSTAITPAKAVLDLKRRNDLVDEAFLEQKDILLDMLEAKLKEVRDKKKKKSEQVEHIEGDTKCELAPNNVDLNLKGNGIIGVGETELKLKFGESGNRTLNLNATGISNVGKTHLNLGIGDGNIYIPGLNNLFIGSSVLKNPCDKQRKIDKENKSKDKNEFNLNDEPQFRRSIEFNNSLVSEKVDDILSTETAPNDHNSNVTEESITVGSLSPDYQETRPVDE